MSAADLIALAERVEALPEPCREIDAEIAVAVYGGEIVWKTANYTMEPYPARRHPSKSHVGGYCNGHVPAFTASLDAAMSLVLGYWHVDLERWADGRGRCEINWAGHTVGVWAATPALALTAAALRARAAE